MRNTLCKATIGDAIKLNKINLNNLESYLCTKQVHTGSIVDIKGTKFIALVGNQEVILSRTNFTLTDKENIKSN